MPSDKIGLYHSKRFNAAKPDEWLSNDDYASLAATSGNDRRPYMLVIQQTIKSDEPDLSDYFVFNGGLRDLCCWDKSLFAAVWKNSGDREAAVDARAVILRNYLEGLDRSTFLMLIPEVKQAKSPCTQRLA